MLVNNLVVRLYDIKQCGMGDSLGTKHDRRAGENVTPGRPFSGSLLGCVGPPALIGQKIVKMNFTIDFHLLHHYNKSMNKHSQTFDNELALRRWVNRQTLQRPISWIEPSINSTLGLPDMQTGHLPPYSNMAYPVWVELKCATPRSISKHNTSSPEFFAQTKIRPNQKKQLKRIVNSQTEKAGLLVAIKNTDIVYALRIRPEALSGDYDFDTLAKDKIALKIDTSSNSSLQNALSFFALDEYTFT